MTKGTVEVGARWMEEAGLRTLLHQQPRAVVRRAGQRSGGIATAAAGGWCRRSVGRRMAEAVEDVLCTTGGKAACAAAEG